MKFVCWLSLLFLYSTCILIYSLRYKTECIQDTVLVFFPLQIIFPVLKNELKDKELKYFTNGQKSYCFYIIYILILDYAFFFSLSEVGIIFGVMFDLPFIFSNYHDARPSS